MVLADLEMAQMGLSSPDVEVSGFCTEVVGSIHVIKLGLSSRPKQEGLTRT